MLVLPVVSSRDERPVAPVVVGNVEISAPVTPFVFEGDLRDLPAPPEWKPGDPVKEIPRRFYPEPGTELQPVYETGPDPLLQSQLDYFHRSITGFTSPTRNRSGQTYTGVNPPDTVGDIGPNYYIQMINSSAGAKVAIYDKAEPTPNQVTTFTLDNLGSGVCAGGLGDPIVLYDRLAQRWMLSEFSSSGNNLCVYISMTDDPVTGGWHAYGFTAPSFPDYPKFGVWATDANGGDGSYIVTANDGGPGIYALDRGAMLAGSPGTYQRVTIPGLPGFGFESPTPADADGANPPPSGAPAIIMRHRDTENHGGPSAPGDLLEMWSFQVDWQTPSNSVFTAEPSIDVAEFDSDLCGLTSFFCFPQPGSGTTLDPLREVIMNRLQYMNHEDRQTLVGNFVVDVDGTDHGGLRWFELEGGHGAWTVVQEGTYSIDADHRWMAASAMDQSGNIAIGYNVSSSSTFPSLRYTGRLVDDPAGVMTQPESVIHDGTASNSSNRYGDYAAMNLDPADDCTFWFTGMDNTTSNWRTQLASFKFDACGCLLAPDQPLLDAVDNGDNRIDVSWDDSSLETVVEYVVRRSRTSGGPYETIAVVPDSSPGTGQGPSYVFADTDVSGGITYYYIVVASDGQACKSAPVNEVAATATGLCTLSPLFDGLQAVSTPFDGVCTLELFWGDATTECGGPPSYDIFRSTTPGFIPGTESLLVSAYPGTTLVDINSLLDSETYYYVVRATDEATGVGEANTNEVAGSPRGSLTTGTWFDDGGDSEPAKMIAESPWQIDPVEGNVGPNVYKTGSYGDLTCAGLRTPQLQLGTGSMLTFYSHYDIESSWDKGEVQISTDGGASWERVPVNYPGTSTHTSDNCGLPTGTYFTGTDAEWKLYSADLSAWQNQSIQLRFAMSSDTSVIWTGWWVDDIMITQVGVPGTCSTGSSCEDNPFVSVVPDGPITGCFGGTVLSAELTGGTPPFAYQWVRDGVEIPGAIGATYVPRDTGTHTYTCKVQSLSCSDKVFDGRPTEITSVSTPFFDGVQSVSDEQAADCSVALGWDPATSVCDGPLAYYIYRDTAPGVSPTPENIVASGLTSTSFVDTGGLSEGLTYSYLVRALDRSTGQFDENTGELAAAPTGPGTGLYTVFTETFPTADALTQWNATIKPGSRTCGAWTTGTASSQRPAGSSGFYVVSSGTVCGNPKTSTALESPSINTNLAGLQSVTLEYDIFFSTLGGSDVGSVEAWDGSAWQIIWSDTGASMNTHHAWDVTAQAAGNSDFRVRFNYEEIDQWFSVDNVEVVVDVVNSCNTRVGPVPVPDGRGGAVPMRGDRASATGDVIDLSWDTSACTAADYNLLFGDLSGVSGYALTGSECALGTAGSHTWSTVPAGDLFFLIVGTDGAGTESSWGTDNLFGERNGIDASGQCVTTAKDTSGGCP